MGLEVTGASDQAHGRALYEASCAPCHGASGEGVYIAAGIRAPPIAGADVAKLVRQVRQGGRIMPPFSSAVLSDAALCDVATYAHEGLARAAGEPARFGPRDLDPFVVGLAAWGSLAVLVGVLAVLFAEGRN